MSRIEAIYRITRNYSGETSKEVSRYSPTLEVISNHEDIASIATLGCDPDPHLQNVQPHHESSYFRVLSLTYRIFFSKARIL